MTFLGRFSSTIRCFAFFCLWTAELTETASGLRSQLNRRHERTASTGSSVRPSNSRCFLSTSFNPRSLMDKANSSPKSHVCSSRILWSWDRSRSLLSANRLEEEYFKAAKKVRAVGNDFRRSYQRRKRSAPQQRRKVIALLCRQNRAHPE